jgi:hypothetical protein
MCHINEADRKGFIALVMQGAMTRLMGEEILHLLEVYVPAHAKPKVDRLMHEAVTILARIAEDEARREQDELWWPDEETAEQRAINEDLGEP